MTRNICPLIAVAFFMAVVVGTSRSIAGDPARHRFIDPLRGLAFKLPPGEWVFEEGFGDVIFRISRGPKRDVVIKWHLNKQVLGEIKRVGVDRSNGKWRVRNEGGLLMASRDARSTLMPSKEARIFRNIGGGVVEISCLADEELLLDMFLICRDLAREVEAVERPAQPEFILDYVLTKALHAYLDGRAGCGGISDGLKKLARESQVGGSYGLSRRLVRLAQLIEGLPFPPGRDDFEKFQEALSATGGFDEGLRAMLEAQVMEQEGRLGVARRIYERLAGKDDGFLASVALVRLDLASGDLGRARQRLSGFSKGSYFLRALRIWAARLSGDGVALSESAEGLGDDVCGYGGAIAMHQLGLAYAGVDPARAIGYFERAIDVAPTYIPAYLSLGTAMLESGEGASVAMDELLRLISLAPQTDSIKALKSRLIVFGDS